MTEDNPHYEIFQRWGIEHLKTLVNNGGLPTHMLGDAATWLGQRDKEARSREEAFRASQRRTGLSTEIAAWIAAAAAIIAAIAAIISVALALK